VHEPVTRSRRVHVNQCSRSRRRLPGGLRAYCSESVAQTQAGVKPSRLMVAGPTTGRAAPRKRAKGAGSQRFCRGSTAGRREGQRAVDRVSTWSVRSSGRALRGSVRNLGMSPQTRRRKLESAVALRVQPQLDTFDGVLRPVSTRRRKYQERLEHDRQLRTTSIQRVLRRDTPNIWGRVGRRPRSVLQRLATLDPHT